VPEHRGEKTIESRQVALKAKELLTEKKGEDVVILDVRDLSSVTDYYLLATGGSPPHLKALSEEVQRGLREAGVRCYRKSGTPDSEWMVADYVDVVVHIFTPASRSYYALEELWNDAQKVG
jgi:ribosome-associated protein